MYARTQFTAADEQPVLDIPDIPSWSENYCFDGYDPQADVGCWLHLGRWPRNPVIWREQVLLYLPDGQHYVVRGFGNHPVLDGAGGALLRITCVEPGKSWRIRFTGPARRLTLDALMRAPDSHLSDGPFQPLDMDLLFEATRPAWDFGDAAKDEDWCTFHYEQHGRLSGTISYIDGDDAARTVAMNGNAYRDHSRGPRDLAGFGGFYWLHGQFPGGRAFSLVQSFKHVDGVRTPGISRAVMFDGDRMVEASFDAAPVLIGRDRPPERFAITISSELGEMALQARILRTIPQSADRYMDQFDGVATPDTGVHYCFEEPTEFVWNGLVGHGHTERAERTVADR